MRQYFNNKEENKFYKAHWVEFNPTCSLQTFEGVKGQTAWQ